ncbi:mitochondrial fission 1 protein A-like [Bidens hawaiensis]|uniref:mitochondrial fission 1 protein A-like n=1 Tax=Bidens hawaiensis TaxID=980011 RepID=UPI00404B6473
MEMIGSLSATPDITQNTSSGSLSNWFGRRWTKMQVVTRKFFKPLRTIFTKEHKIRWIDDPSVIKDCHNQYNAALKVSSDEDIDKCFTRLTYTLVHSTQVEDVLHGIELLEEGFLKNDNNSNNERMPDKTYQLALGYYRCEEYNKSLELLNRCIENSHNHEKALTLQKKVEAQIRRDELLCAGCACFTCCAGVLGTYAATGQSDKQKYERLRE